MTDTKAAPRRAAAKKPSTRTTPTRRAAKTATKTAAKASDKAAAKAPAPVTKLKQKLVRDSFTIPKAEYTVLEGLKLRAAQLQRPTKKSELLRGGIAALHAMDDKTFLALLATVPSLKTGRPKGSADAKPAKARNAPRE